MTAYFIRRLLLVIPTFIGITVMVFTITRFVPGGPIERIIAETRALQMGQGGGSPSSRAGVDSGQPLSQEQIEKLKAYYGFDKPILESYVSWLGNVLKGDLGRSTRYHDSVWEMIRDRIPIS
ncbi:MAG: ABC transporter permease, partial [Desulfobacterales bacterium]|nr:ABC transporter permease [Desulfobacterales bacterium]